MKGIFLILDGVADEGCKVLEGKTPLQVAMTPNLDSISRKSRIDHCYSVKEGVAPDSSSAIVSLFGYDPRFAPRGPLEALGAGMKLSHGDLALRTNFATIDDLENRSLMDRRAGRTLSSKEAKILANVINSKVKLPFKFEFRPTNQHRGVLVFRGGFSDNVSNIDPAYGSGFVSYNPSTKVEFSKPLDDEDDSKLAADLINNFVRQSFSVLDKHPVNFTRAKKGLFSANFVLCRGAGSESLRLKKLKGKWAACCYTPFEKGFALATKMDLKSFTYPKMNGIDVYANLNEGLRRSVKHIIKTLKRNKNKYDYFYIHIKETDVPGRDNKPLEKVKMIELLDRKLFGFLKNFVMKNKSKLVITSGFTTSSRKKSHSEAPVPVLFYNPSEEFDKEHRFTEEQGVSGRRIAGQKLVERTLFEK